MARTAEELLPYIESRCTKVGDCWLWQGSYSRGYPQMEARAVFPIVKRVSQIVFFLANGHHPADGNAIHHTCLTRACCNPEHLVEMSTAEHNRLHAVERHKAKGHAYRPKRRGRGCAECNRIAAKERRRVTSLWRRH